MPDPCTDVPSHALSFAGLEPVMLITYSYDAAENSIHTVVTGEALSGRPIGMISSLTLLAGPPERARFDKTT